jgi:hypothetical protein
MSGMREAVSAVVEGLESRTMMAASPLAISQVQLIGGGAELHIQGTAKTNKLTLSEQGGQFLVADNGVSQTVSGEFADVRIYGGAGNDSIVVDSSVTTDCFLYGGAGRNTLQAGSGNDMLVCIGSTADTLSGGAGSDSFWTDNKSAERITNLTAAEAADGAVHRVSSYYTGPSTKIAVTSAKAKARATEPGTTNGATYQDFSNHPLFAAFGPSENDVIQGQIGDCYYLSVLSSVAKLDANKIEQSILDMGDGTYLVQFSKGGSNVFVHVDGQLPVLSGGQLDYAGLGAGGSIWTAIMEKAYAVFHGPTASYASIDGGWMDEVYSALGDLPKSNYGGAGAAALMSLIAGEVSLGESVTYGTGNAILDNAPLIGGHAYTVDSIVTNAQGVATGLRLRNPWGIDGAGNDGNNDGYVIVTPQQAYDCLAGTVAAFV